MIAQPEATSSTITDTNENNNILPREPHRSYVCAWADFWVFATTLETVFNERDIDRNQKSGRRLNDSRNKRGHEVKLEADDPVVSEQSERVE